MKRAPRFAGIGGHHSPKAKTEEWLTPPGLIDALGGPLSFDLDPCAPIEQPYPTARQVYTQLDNGLLKPWFGRVWLNPPYSLPLLGRFMGRMVDHGQGLALIFARTETDIFFRFVWETASAALFLRGRINFHHVDGSRANHNAGGPSVLCAYGNDEVERLAACGLAGQLVPLILPRLLAVAAIEPTWLELIRQQMAGRSVLRVDEVYRAIAAHPKARGNRNVRAKVRQVLGRGGFKRLAPGVFAL